MELSEEKKIHKCKCETCGYKYLKHFQKCPNCKSQAYHLTIVLGKAEEKKEN